MKKFRNYILASVGFAVLACTISLTATGRATAEKVADAAVRVYNTETQPLFVKTVGTVPVRGDVHVSGGGVSFSNVPSEPISNRAILFAMDIFDENLDLTIQRDDPARVKKFLVTVPAGKTLKIESINGTASVHDTRPLQPFIQLFKNNIPVGLFLMKEFHVDQTFGTSEWTVNNSLSPIVYAKAGDTVEVMFTTYDPGEYAEAHLHFTGTYFDTP